MTKKIGKDAAEENNLTIYNGAPEIQHNYTFDQTNFIWQNGRTVTDILDRNGPEFVRFALMVATQQPDSKLGAEFGKMLLKSILPASKKEKEDAHKRLFTEIKAFDEVTLQKLASGEISAEDLEMIDGSYIYSKAAETTEKGEEIVKPKHNLPADGVKPAVVPRPGLGIV
jgi:hypothetical protein